MTYSPTMQQIIDRLMPRATKVEITDNGQTTEITHGQFKARCRSLIHEKFSDQLSFRFDDSNPTSKVVRLHPKGDLIDIKDWCLENGEYIVSDLRSMKIGRNVTATAWMIDDVPAKELINAWSAGNDLKFRAFIALGLGVKLSLIDRLMQRIAA